jgi:archaemetzincin
LGPPSIILIPFEPFEKDLTNWISDDICDIFHYPVEVRECNTDLSNCYNPGRRQHDANMILKLVSDITPPEAVKSVGLLKVDLFIPILTHIFGQAALHGKTAIVSIFRLRNELYGLRQNYMLQNERLRKVVIHELGHTFGITHCFSPNCVMRSSTYVEDLDQKGIHLCNVCLSELDSGREENANRFER